MTQAMIGSRVMLLFLASQIILSVIIWLIIRNKTWLYDKTGSPGTMGFLFMADVAIGLVVGLVFLIRAAIGY